MEEREPGTRIKRPSAVAVVALLLLSACDGGAPNEPFPGACRLPSPKPGIDPGDIPPELVMEGSVARDAGKQGGLAFVAFNTPAGIDEAYAHYLDVLGAAPYGLLNTENEGFEAELYARNVENGDAVAVQMRNPGCEEAISLVVTVGKVPDPTGSGVPSPGT